MIDAALSRSVRVRSYWDVVRDAGRIFRLALGVDVHAILKRVAFVAVPKVQGRALTWFWRRRPWRRHW